MAYLLDPGIHVSLTGLANSWQKLTDHNRGEISITPSLIEKESRMANGTLRKFIVAQKDSISVSWSFLPSTDSSTTTATLASGSSGGGIGSSHIVISGAPINLLKTGSGVSATGLQSNTKIIKDKKAIVSSATVSGLNIVYTTSVDHDFSALSFVNVFGFTSAKFNIQQLQILSVTSNTFTVANTVEALGSSSGSAKAVVPGIADTLLGSGNLPRTLIQFDKTATSQVSGVITFTIPELIVDGHKGASWITAFYNANVGIPVYIKIVSAKHEDPSTGTLPVDSTYKSSKTGETEYQVFMTGFSKTIVKRNQLTDFLDIKLDFTEI